MGPLIAERPPSADDGAAAHVSRPSEEDEDGNRRGRYTPRHAQRGGPGGLNGDGSTRATS